MPKCNLEQIEALSDNNYWYYPIDQGVIGYNAVEAPDNYDTHVCPYCGKISHCRNDVDVDDIIDIDDDGKPTPPRPPFPPHPHPHPHPHPRPIPRPQPDEDEEECDCEHCANKCRCAYGQYYRPYQYYGYRMPYPFWDYRQFVYPYLLDWDMPLYTEWLGIQRDH